MSVFILFHVERKHYHQEISSHIINAIDLVNNNNNKNFRCVKLVSSNTMFIAEIFKSKAKTHNRNLKSQGSCKINKECLSQITA